jgi:hypothetical protein
MHQSVRQIASEELPVARLLSSCTAWAKPGSCSRGLPGSAISFSWIVHPFDRLRIPNIGSCTCVASALVQKNKCAEPLGTVRVVHPVKATGQQKAARSTIQGGLGLRGLPRQRPIFASACD